MTVMLDPQQRRTLHVLGYLCLRMGQMDRAARVFAVLAALPADVPDRQAYSGLAAVALDKGDAATALKHLYTAMEGEPLSSRRSALHLLRAQALWREDRKDEAKSAVDEYLYLAGSSTGA